MSSTVKPDSTFASRLLRWFDHHGRHDLPWQDNPTPYRVWVSEIMLQQTQVSTVIPYYLRFMQRFPDVATLARADTDQVLHLWTGLGYYARARNLHKAAQTIRDKFAGELPTSVEQLQTLAGIGQSTAGAIAALSLGVRAPILDGNVKRVLTRFHAIADYPEQTAVKQRLWEIAESLTPKKRFSEFTQAIMDLGATVCTRSSRRCTECPLQTDCKALRSNSIASYPGKKPRKILPVKSVTMFILQNNRAEVLLEKRPARGIWGSLYSLPEAEDANAPQLTSIHHIVLPTKNREALKQFRHSFSHYHLDINPVRIKVGAQDSIIADSNRWLWYPLDHSLEVGLAAPVKKLLSSLLQE